MLKTHNENSKQPDGVSVIICCYNSIDRISETLQHLVAQRTLNNFPWEIVLVDNASTDETKAVAADSWERHGDPSIPFRIVDETIPGLSAARQRGIDSAQFEVIVFCDDDNLLSENYIQSAYEILSSNPSIGAIGGRSTAKTEGDFPEWWDTYKGYYAVGEQAKAPGNVAPRKFLWGSGLSLRKSLWNEIFKEHPSILTGRLGNNLTSGEDSEICARLLILGYQLHYYPDLSFVHLIPTQKLTTDYRDRLLAGLSETKSILRPYRQYIDYLHLTKFHRELKIAKLFNKALFYSITANPKSSREFNALFIVSGKFSAKASHSAKIVREVCLSLQR
ncbi:MAG: glycosyltransferase [Luteolibacter sp.]